MLSSASNCFYYFYGKLKSHDVPHSRKKTANRSNRSMKLFTWIIILEPLNHAHINIVNIDISMDSFSYVFATKLKSCAINVPEHFTNNLEKVNKVFFGFA